MEELNAYLSLVKDNIPPLILRQGLERALEPLGIRVDVSEDPLYIPSLDLMDSYNMTSPLKRRRYGGGINFFKEINEFEKRGDRRRRTKKRRA